MAVLTPADEAEYLALLEAQVGGEGLDDFIRRALPRLPPPAHVAPLRALIERTRHEEVRALVSMPPRHVKTMTLLPGLAWRIQRDPVCLNAYAGYGDDFARSKSKQVRRLALETGVHLLEDTTAANDWRTPYGGGLLATGIGGPLTGQGITGVLVIDDPIKNRLQAESALERQKVWEWFTDVAYTRLEPGSSVIVCATRWHADDLIGRLQGEDLGDHWEVLELPAVSVPAGTAVDERLADDACALWPEEYSLEKLGKIRATLGEYGWWSLYQQQPRPRGDAMFREPSRYDLEGFDLKGFRIVNAVDPAASEKTRADYSVCVTAAAKGWGEKAELYILDVRRWQVQVPVLVKELLAIQKAGRWGKGAPLVVEAVGGFKAIPQMLRAAEPQLRVKEVLPQGDKFTRAQPLAVAWNAGRIHVPREAPWLAAYLAEMEAFTGVSDVHDDQVDATVHAYEHLCAASSDVARFEALATW